MSNRFLDAVLMRRAEEQANAVNKRTSCLWCHENKPQDGYFCARCLRLSEVKERRLSLIEEALRAGVNDTVATPSGRAPFHRRPK